MRKVKPNQRRLALFLMFILMVGQVPISLASAADPEVLDQEQASFFGNVWTNQDSQRYQTFTPAISGHLARIENSFMDSFGDPGFIKVDLYKESDLSTLLASATASPSANWVSFDFSGTAPYLKRENLYRMVVSTQNGGSSGVGWHLSPNEAYPRGTSAALNRDFAFRTYMIPDYSISADESTLLASSSSLTADGTSQTAVTVSVKNAQGQASSTGGETIGITSSLGTISAVTDHNDGTYSATLTAPTISGSATISATLNGNALSSTAIVQFVPGPASAANSTVEANKTSAIADGNNGTRVTVRLKDTHGNPLTSGGATVGIASSLGTIGSVTDRQDGTYMAMLTAPATKGTAAISATLNGTPLTSTASVQFVPGASSPSTSEIQADKASLTADGTSHTLITVKLKDAQGNMIEAGGATVSITSTSGAVGSVTDHQDGTYTATLTAPTTSGTAKVSATVDGNPLVSTASVQFVPGAASATASTVDTQETALTADGTSQTSVTVTLKDANGNRLTSGGADVAIASTLGTVGTVTDNQDGTYTATLTAPTAIGTASVSATLDGTPLTSTVSVQFVPGEASASRSSVTASDAMVRADGSSSASIRVRLNDAHDHPLPNKRIILRADGGQSAIEPESALTDEDGTAVFSVSNTAAEKVTYSAEEEASGLTLDQTTQITFIYNQPPSIKLKASPTLPTFGDVTVRVTSSVYGEFNQTAATKWAEGHQPISYFDTQGTDLTDSFTVQKNGVYSVYVRDTAGNANVSTIEIDNIVPLSSNANLADWKLTGRGGSIPFEFAPETTAYHLNAADSVYALNMVLTAPDAYAVMDVNGQQVDSGSVTRDYPLARGKNIFEVHVRAQDGSVKTYTLTITRAAADSGSSGSPNSSGPAVLPSSPTVQPTSGQALQAWLNGVEVGGVASLQTDAKNTRSVEASLNLGTLQKALGSPSDWTNPNLRISIPNEADSVTLRLLSDALSPLVQQNAILTLETEKGRYSLPLAEIGPLASGGSGSEVQMTIRTEDSNSATSGLQDAVSKNGLKIVGEPVHFEVYTVEQGQKKEVTSFGRYVERVLYLPTGSPEAATTAVVWDEKHGIRPVPTAFTTNDGRPAAVIRSRTNSVYALVSRASTLTDLQGHWAASEIASMNRRMIVQGVDAGRFAPEAPITRAELATLLVRALGLPESAAPADFRDVSAASWYAEAVSSASMYGLMDGVESGTFEPERQVSRQEAVVALMRALPFMDARSIAVDSAKSVDLTAYIDEAQVGGWAKDAMQTAIEAGLVKGYGKELRPQQALTRAEMTVMLYRMLVQTGFINE